MNTPLRFSQTYLHKLHVLTNNLDKAFDQILRTHASLTLSQFMLLIAVAEHKTINQRKAAQFVGISPPAIKRQVDIALAAHWLDVTTSESLGQALHLTPQGRTMVKQGLHALDKHLFKIFSDSDRQANLMTHIHLLLGHTKGVVTEQAIWRKAQNHK